jgi:hypothetical protein
MLIKSRLLEIFGMSYDCTTENLAAATAAVRIRLLGLNLERNSIFKDTLRVLNYNVLLTHS